jgi:hypothetical protein
VDTQQVCDGHGLKLRRCVAFAGVNTGCRFYMCSIENVSFILGFVFVLQFNIGIVFVLQLNIVFVLQLNIAFVPAI